MPGKLIVSLINGWLWLRNSLRRLLRRRVDYVYMELGGELPEFADELSIMQRLLGAQQTNSMAELRRRLRRIAADPQTRGIILVLREFSPGWATAEGLRAELLHFRERGKRVVVFLPGADTRAYFVACAADEVLMPETAYLYLLGVQAEAMFLGDALRMVGIESELVAVSPYKSGGDTLARSEMSPESREQLERLLNQRYEQLVDAIASARSLSPEQVRTLIDAAPHGAPAAHSRGLIDATCYEDELATRLAPPSEGQQPARPVQVHRWRAASRALRIPYRRYYPRFVAVVSVEGAILPGKSRKLPLPLPLFGGKQAGSESVGQALRRVERNKRIAALVLHVDSPGGDSFASDLIWREVLRVRQHKPVVVSMGNVAASGGYYVAACATCIVAQPATLTGSIGVYALRPVAEQLFERIGVHTTLLHRGARAAFLSPTHAPDDDEREVLRRLVFESYDIFKQRVQQGRGLSAEQLEPIAGGRVWTGREAHEVGLVDELGTLPHAIARARALGKLPADDAAPVLRVMPPRPRRQDTLPLPFPDESPAALVAALDDVLRLRVLAALPWMLKE
jgi:protease-4